jgi:hypothetical protein
MGILVTAFSLFICPCTLMFSECRLSSVSLSHDSQVHLCTQDQCGIHIHAACFCFNLLLD